MYPPELIVSLDMLLTSHYGQYTEYIFSDPKWTLGQASDLNASTIGIFKVCGNQFKIWKDIEQYTEKQQISLEPVRVLKRRLQQMDLLQSQLWAKAIH